MSDAELSADPDRMDHFATACAAAAATTEEVGRSIASALQMAELADTSSAARHHVVEQLGLLARVVELRAEELRFADAGFQPPWLGLYTRDATALSAQLGAHLADTDWLQAAVGFLAGDIANFWNGNRDDEFPVGQLTASMIRVGRTAAYMRNPLNRALFPTFNTGLVGRGLASGLQLVPESFALARAGSWLASPAATTAFTRVGVAGGLIGTATGSYNLYQQGNPIDAFQREGAGYVADVASTAFSASSTAFFLAPNPVTGALVVVTGVVWAGAEIVDHWDDITDWTSNTWQSTTQGASVLWDYGTARLDDTLDNAGAFVGDRVDDLSDVWDAGTGVAESGLDAVGDLARAANPLSWF